MPSASDKAKLFAENSSKNSNLDDSGISLPVFHSRTNLKLHSCPGCWKVSSVVPVFNNIGERSTAKNYRPVSFLSVVSRVFEKFVNNRIVDYLEKCGLFSDLQNCFKSSRSNADLLTVVSDRIARAFNRSGAT